MVFKFTKGAITNVNRYFFEQTNENKTNIKCPLNFHFVQIYYIFSRYKTMNIVMFDRKYLKKKDKKIVRIGITILTSGSIAAKHDLDNA